MDETRQQRRARERAEAKATRRGTTVTAGLPQVTYVVDVSETHDDDEHGWIAEGGIEDESSGVEFEWSESLAELLDDVRYEVDQWRNRYEVTVRYTLDGDGDDEAMQAAARREGVELVR
jgi:hypothetical protein